MRADFESAKTDIKTEIVNEQIVVNIEKNITENCTNCKLNFYLQDRRIKIKKVSSLT